MIAAVTWLALIILFAVLMAWIDRNIDDWVEPVRDRIEAYLIKRKEK